LLYKIESAFQYLQFTRRSIPLALLGACILAYGLLIPRLGIYQDDWHFVFYAYSLGLDSLKELLTIDGRPFASWIYALVFGVWGFKPFYWQVVALVVRWLTVTFIWASFDLLWPKAIRQNFTAALFFALYPFFRLQPSAVDYTQHWTVYFLYSLSVYLMLRAQRERFWLNTVLALLSQSVHLFTNEYFFGLELLRPILIWLAINHSQLGQRTKLSQSLLRWLPYLTVLVLYLVWRFTLSPALSLGMRPPIILDQLASDPFQTLINVFVKGLPDLALILVSSWYEILKPGTVDLGVSANRYGILLTLIGFAICFFYYSRLSRDKSGAEDQNQWAKQALMVGAVSVLLGLLPAYVGGYVILERLPPWNSRFSLGSLFGAALLITVFLETIITGYKQKLIMISLLVGLLFGWHFRSGNDFRAAWDKQINFYRQLTLRAPYIQPHTMLLSEEEFLGYMGDYPTTFALNTIYSPPLSAQRGNEESGATSQIQASRDLGLWFFPYSEFYSKFGSYLAGTEISEGRATMQFHGHSQDSLIVSFRPEDGQCLWILRPQDAAGSHFSSTLKDLMRLSSIQRIVDDSNMRGPFLERYLLKKQPQDWCYYYQKADLARQYTRWDEILGLWESAQESNLQPDHGFEYAPFVEAYAHQSEWQTALKLTRTANKITKGMSSTFCSVWSELEKDTPPSAEREQSLVEVRDMLSCGQSE